MTKIYAHAIYSSTDERLFALMNEQKELNKKGKRIKSLILKKNICNTIRKQLNVNCLIGLLDSKDNLKIGIALYDIEANDDIFLPQRWDEEQKKFYIEI